MCERKTRKCRTKWENIGFWVVNTQKNIQMQNKGGEKRTEIPDLHSVSDLELFQEVAKRLEKRTSSTNDSPSDSISVSIFSTSLSPFGALVKYLHENKHTSFTEIGHLLNRSAKTTWQAYQTAHKKQAQPFSSQKGECIPLSAFSDRKFSITEALVHYLSQKYRPKQIATMLHRSQKNINTFLSRARNKDAKQ